MIYFVTVVILFAIIGYGYLDQKEKYEEQIAELEFEKGWIEVKHQPLYKVVMVDANNNHYTEVMQHRRGKHPTHSWFREIHKTSLAMAEARASFVVANPFYSNSENKHYAAGFIKQAWIEKVTDDRN